MLSKEWNSNSFQERRDEIKQVMAYWERSEDPQNIEVLLLEQIDRLLDEFTPDKNLSIFIWILNALLHFISHYKKNESQSRRLIELADKILRINGVTSTSRMGYLHTYLRSLEGQLLSRAGDHEMGLWLQHGARIGIRHHSPEEEGFLSYTHGKNLLRVGDSEGAVEHLESALSQGLSNERVIKCRLALLNCARLSLNSNLFETNSEHLGKLTLDEEFVKEHKWEEFNQRCREKQNYDELFAWVRKEQKEKKFQYLLDAQLLNYALPTVSTKLPLQKMETLRKKGALQDQDPTFRKVLAGLEQIEAEALDAHRTVVKCGKIAVEARSFNIIERELLSLVAISRILKKSRSYEHCRLVLRRYSQLSLALTKGLSADCYKISPN